MSFKYQREKCTKELFDEVYPLLEKHYEEITHYKDIPLDPNVQAYLKLEEIGTLRVYTVREEGEIVGYASFLVSRNIHYKTCLQALQDIIYIDPSKRGFGAKFIIWCDMQLKKEGVQIVYHHIKKKHNFGPLLERMGYELIDLIYGRRLNHGSHRSNSSNR